MKEDIYQTLRHAHSIIKDIETDETWTYDDNNALDAVHSVLYLAESHFLRDEAPSKLENKIERYFQLEKELTNSLKK